jgi:hypothetical protein
MTNEFAIVVRGISGDVQGMKSCLSAYSKKIIFSCWEGEESKYSTEDTVVYNDKKTIPDGPYSFIVQKTAILSGLKKAKDLGYENVILIRSDLFFSLSENIIPLFDFERLNFLCWHTNSGGYFVDYLMAGKIDHLNILWDANAPWKSATCEKIITNQYVTNLIDNVKINFILGHLDRDRDIFWSRFGIWLSSYKQYPEYIHNNNSTVSFSI